MPAIIERACLAAVLEASVFAMASCEEHRRLITMETGHLIWWNRLWLCLLILGVVVWVVPRSLYQAAESGYRRLAVTWEGDGLRFTSASDGPFIVTHLMIAGIPDAAQKSIAQLPNPIAIIDSYGARLDAAAYRKLTWRTYFGEPAPSPPVGSPIQALYYRPLRTEIPRK